MSELDWGALQQEAKSAAALPDGDYPAFVLDAEATTSSTGKPMIKAQYRITDGPAKDKKVRTQFVVSAESPVALRIFFQQMAMHGLDAAYFDTKPPLANVAGQLKGKHVNIELGTRQWQGNDVNEVKNYKPYTGGGSPSPLTAPGGTTTPSPLATPIAPANPSGPPVPVTTPSAPPTPSF